jgi:outer membrane protein TolC
MPALPGDVEALVARTLERSPERAELLAEREAARSRLAGVQADRRPTVSAVGTIGYSYDDRDSREGGEGAYIRVSLQASLPLLRERSNRPRRQFQEQDIELQDLLIQRLEREARETVLLAYNALQRNAVAVQAARDAVREAEEALRLARGRYEVGRGTQIDVLDKLAAVTRAQNRLATTREAAAIAAYRLSILTGLEPAIAGAERGAGGPTVSAPAPVPMGSVPPGTTPSEGASPPRAAPE